MFRNIFRRKPVETKDTEFIEEFSVLIEELRKTLADNIAETRKLLTEVNVDKFCIEKIEIDGIKIKIGESGGSVDGES